jgi:hypothetical protein
MTKVFPSLSICVTILVSVLITTNIGCMKNPSGVYQEGRETHGYSMQRVNLKLDEKSVIQIAETVFVRVYGKDVLEQRPWVVTEREGVFEIQGTFHGRGVGGVALMTIDPATAEVLMITHTK